MNATIYPELVVGRDDGFVYAPWTVRPGSTRRGEASCNLTERILEVPLGSDATSRVVQAHELMHARVSPHLLAHYGEIEETSPRALECAEELRINTLIGRLDFNVSLLRDGSEKAGARRIAESADWSEAVCFLMAVLGTGGEKEYLAGIRRVEPTWLPGLRAVRKRALAILDGLSSATLGATRLNEEGLPSGYANSTIVLARILTQTMQARPPATPEELRNFRRSLEPGGRRPPTGRFAPLKFDETLLMSPRPRGTGMRRDRASTCGPTMRYPSRLLTDEKKRAFVRRASRHGGIVIIDQSGSMEIDEASLTTLLRRAPDALVIGYSHRPGDTGLTPNVWVLADRGSVTTTIPSGNIGNGVDGAVLAWAIRQRHLSEPIVWVTDGQVTDSHDHPDDRLTSQCAELVRRHRIRLVKELREAGPSLSGARKSNSSQRNEFGRLGRKLLEMRTF
ncbi:MAG TPA: hypothetical protein VMU68_14370 [Acidimicrobiales bacterium]|nr:hypothetical protein [Acidimicrobiales bacterium]